MKVYNREEHTRQTLERFKLACRMVDKDGYIHDVSPSEYKILLDHFEVDKRWFSWPKINGVTVIRRAGAK